MGGQIVKLNSRVALVTGAAGGIGERICHRLAADGASVIVTDIGEAVCSALAETLPSPHMHMVRALDVTSESSWLSTVARIDDRYGHLDILVNNAGGGAGGHVADECLESWNRIIAVNQTGTWLGMKHAGALIQKTGGGAIVNISSILGVVGGFGGLVSYAAAKGAVTNLTKNAAVHWAPHNVRVNSVHPGYVATPQVISKYENTEFYDAMIANTPMGRLARPDEIAAVVTFLASDDASYMTGSEVRVDGGWTAR
jgi:3alpha(or 20beta)-hydroxysteroid dehydrogenase